MRKYYSFETNNASTEQRLSEFLRSVNIYYHASSVFNDAVHFEMFCNEKEAKMIRNWIEKFA